MRGKQTVNHWIRCGIQGRETLNESGNGDVRLRFWNVVVHLQQIEDDVRTPAQHED